MTEQDDLRAELAALRERVSELESRSSDGTLSGTLRAIVEGTAVVTGDKFFDVLVRYLAKSIDAKYVFIGEIAMEGRLIRTRSVWAGDRWGRELRDALAGTPCEAVLDGKVRHYADRVQLAFPTIRCSKALGVRSYLAVPLTAGDGRDLGHLAMMDVNREIIGNRLKYLSYLCCPGQRPVSSGSKPKKQARCLRRKEDADRGGAQLSSARIANIHVPL